MLAISLFRYSNKTEIEENDEMSRRKSILPWLDRRGKWVNGGVVGSRILVRCMRALNKYRRDGSTEALSRLAHINAKEVHATSSIDMSIAINSVRGQVMLRHKLVKALLSRINLCKAM